MTYTYDTNPILVQGVDLHTLDDYEEPNTLAESQSKEHVRIAA